jgi:hypothetical protein
LFTSISFREDRVTFFPEALLSGKQARQAIRTRISAWFTSISFREDRVSIFPEACDEQRDPEPPL